MGCFYPKSQPMFGTVNNEARKFSSPIEWDQIQGSLLVSGMYEQIKDATTLPFSGAASTSPQNIVQSVSVLTYLARKYPELFVYPPIYNMYLSIAVRRKLRSVPSIFLQCFEHFAETHESSTSAESSSTDRQPSFYPWHWPLPEDEHNVVPHLPSKLPRPTKYTFMAAMEYARSGGDVQFAHRVWRCREAWRRRLARIVWQQTEAAMWSELRDEEMTSYAELLSQKGETEFDWPSMNFPNSFNIGHSKGLYEGYTRLLYIETLVKGGYCSEAFKMILEGTGERYEWTQEMLHSVRRMATEHGGHEALVKYIDDLEPSLVEMEQE